MVMVNDPIGDLLTRLRNAQRARRSTCRVPWSRKKQTLCIVLKEKGWIASVDIEGEGTKKDIVVTFASEHPSLTLTRISTPGRRVYCSAKKLKPVLQGFGMAILTTNHGMICDQEARKKNIGGEVICTVS